MREPTTSFVDEVMERAATDDAETRAFLGELAEMAERVDVQEGQFPHAQAFGVARFLTGTSSDELVREVLRLGHRLEEFLAQRGRLEGDARDRFHAVVDESAAQAVRAHETAARSRRDDWLSFYVHDMRNPLNTLVNALWILRHADGVGQAQRVCDMAERAVKRLEGTIREVRELEQKASEVPPRKPGDTH